MNTEPDAIGDALNGPAADRMTILGVKTAINFVRSGRIISAIKHIEVANPGISREKAKSIVYSFGYSCEMRWPELEKWPERDRQRIRCL